MDSESKNEEIKIQDQTHISITEEFAEESSNQKSRSRDLLTKS
jgi:hypothetical protein